VKPRVAILAGLVLLLMADILTRAYQLLPLAFALPETFSASSIPVLLSLITVVPLTVIAYHKCIHSRASTVHQEKANPILIGILCGSLFFVLFMLTMAQKSESAQLSYLLRLASFSQYLRGSGLLELTAFAVSVHILRPILEEVVFRGLILQSLAEKYGLVLGVFFSSAGFALIHSGLEFSPALAFIFGVVSCALVYFSRGMAASFGFHITYNSLVTIIGYLRGS